MYFKFCSGNQMLIPGFRHKNGQVALKRSLESPQSGSKLCYTFVLIWVFTVLLMILRKNIVLSGLILVI